MVLHGCTQSAAGYNYHSGWSALAESRGFILLFPQQKRANNPNLCFNWFSPRDARRGRGEALSIAQMIGNMHERHGTDASKTFITGLSAGGAMAAVMLATYPELFAAGAIIAGLPFGTANNVPQALERMRGQQLPDQARLGKLVRTASDFAGSWPVLSVWHGTQDQTVAPVNAKAIIDQWRELHHLGEAPSIVEAIGDHTRRVWLDQRGREVIEEYEVNGLAHGTPLRTLDADSDEIAGPHMLEAGISSTRMIARSWGIGEPEGSNSAPSQPGGEQDWSHQSPETRRGAPPSSRATDKVARAIENALRSARLLR